MVAPVVGDTNLLAQSCCMMRPAVLMPMPVQRMARSLGKREISMSSSDSISPESTSAGVMSAAPTKSERTLISVSSTRRMQVDRVIETNVPQ